MRRGLVYGVYDMADRCPYCKSTSVELRPENAYCYDCDEEIEYFCLEDVDTGVSVVELAYDSIMALRISEQYRNITEHNNQSIRGLK